VRLLLLAGLCACSSGKARPATRDAGPAKLDAARPDAARDDTPRAPPDGLVDVVTVIPDAVFDLRYATANNFTGAAVYDVARCWLRAEVAERLAQAAAALRDAGYRLVLWDCYRPASVQQLLWARVPDPAYVAEPAFDADGRPVRGSVHSRAAAVDLSVADLDGTIELMPTDHDAFGAAAHRDHVSDDPAVRARMRLLDDAMTGAGFEGLPTEWWHYGLRGAASLPLLDVPLE